MVKDPKPAEQVGVDCPRVKAAGTVDLGLVRAIPMKAE
jgi:hypothetical protein